MPLKMRFGTAVKKQRSELGISQEELAGRAGLHRTYVSDVERGARNLSLENIEKLARALQISIATLFERAGENGRSENLVEILLVEDNPQDVDLTLRAFAKAKITNTVQVVEDGLEALDFIFAKGKYLYRREDFHPKLILLDLALPKIGGLEVLRRVKANPRTREIPVIVLTASNQAREIAECRRLGAADYIVKPVGFQNFSAVTPHLAMQWALVKSMEQAGGANAAERK